MRITPVYQNYYSPKFTSNRDLSDSLKDKISQGLSNLINGDNDEFIPMQPTQPIVVREVKIYKSEGHGKTEAVAGVGGLGGGIGISKLKGKGSSDNTENKTDFNKIAEESVQETRTNNQDEYSDISDDVDQQEDLEITLDGDMDDYDEE